MSNPRYQPNRRQYFLKGGQAKLDVDGDGKITGKDFAMLRNKKKKKKKEKPSMMMLAMRDKRNMGASKSLEEQLAKAKKEGKVEKADKKGFINKKARGTIFNKKIKELVYGDN